MPLVYAFLVMAAAVLVIGLVVGAALKLVGLTVLALLVVAGVAFVLRRLRDSRTPLTLDTPADRERLPH